MLFPVCVQMGSMKLKDKTFVGRAIQCAEHAMELTITVFRVG